MSRRRGRPKGSKDGTGVAQPIPFRVVAEPGGLAVYVGERMSPLRASEVAISAPSIVHARPAGGVAIVGEGVVRQHGDRITVTA